ncbi:SYF2 splicing factor-domain-containing protein [Dimargaris cristalligena]|uniref:Pre-mRNA-splicing factor SYF2 n=1 Tax=Dimargaris cristalligena TaxID=215637 RepID=A0A4P9ZRM3_9FUNG|nr:SYF2 splicing factor-domain-containing protein [Dimargaris cristalligena]|eukprot:RKP36057.1 SYF2 splicing factor-domain-containing protein [Dimargaris cristalligena]
MSTSPLPLSESREASPSSSSDSEVDEQTPDAVQAVLTSETAPDTLKERALRLQQVRSLLASSSTENKRDLYAEKQREKSDPRQQAKQERTKREAEILQARETATEQGVDYERSRFWDYSIDAVEKWNAKQEAKKTREQEARFASHGQWAEKKYRKMVDKLKPDLQAYREQQIQSAIGQGQDWAHSEVLDSVVAPPPTISGPVDLLHQPSQHATDKLAKHVEKEIDHRQKLSRRKRDDENLTYINEKNKRFNKRIAQAYDKHTQDIRDSFERGTAL